MIELGLIPEKANIELLDGVMVCKDRGGLDDPQEQIRLTVDPTTGVVEQTMAISPDHRLCVELVRDLNADVGPYGFHVSSQQPVTITLDDEPEPDASFIRGRVRDYRGRTPAAADMAVAVEVSSTSLLTDRTTKLRLYAIGGIPQYVILNLIDRQAEVHHDPRPDGTYGRREVVGPGGTIRFVLDEHTLDVPLDDLLP